MIPPLDLVQEVSLFWLAPPTRGSGKVAAHPAIASRFKNTAREITSGCLTFFHPPTSKKFLSSIGSQGIDGICH